MKNLSLIEKFSAKRAEIKRVHDDLIYNERGAIGYILAWLMGVPVTVLVIIFVLRGFH